MFFWIGRNVELPSAEQNKWIPFLAYFFFFPLVKQVGYREYSNKISPENKLLFSFCRFAMIYHLSKPNPVAEPQPPQRSDSLPSGSPGSATVAKPPQGSPGQAKKQFLKGMDLS